MDMNSVDETAVDLYEERLDNAPFAEKALIKLRKMNNEHFIKFILKHSDCNELNNVVADGKFPAYDIVQRAQSKHWQLTDKQRHAITNVYLWDCYGWKQEELEE